MKKAVIGSVTAMVVLFVGATSVFAAGYKERALFPRQTQQVRMHAERTGCKQGNRKIFQYDSLDLYATSEELC